MNSGSSTTAASPNSSTTSSSNSSSSSGSSSITRALFSSPFLRRKPKLKGGSSSNGLKLSKLEERLLLQTVDDGQDAVSKDQNSASNREELLRLFLLKLDEEANYFQVGPASPEDDLCECQKCQVNITLTPLGKSCMHSS